MKKLIHRLLRWLSGDDARVLDRYLSRASNVADVQHLLHQWESRERSAWDCTETGVPGLDASRPTLCRFVTVNNCLTRDARNPLPAANRP